MSWSVTLIGKPENIAAALEKEAEKLDGQSRLEFEAAMPHLQGLVRENFAKEGTGSAGPILRLAASGSGHVRDGEQLYRSCGVTLESFYGMLV